MLSIFLRSAIRSNIWFRSSSSSSLSSTKIISSRCLSFRTKYENQFHSHYHNNRWNRYSQSIINYSNQRYLSGNNRIVSFNLSDIGEGISEVVIKEWFVNIGDHVQQFDNICEVQSDKASVTITSRYDGQIKKIYYQIDDMAKVGQPLVDILIDSDDNSTESEPENQKIIMINDESNNNNNLATINNNENNHHQDYLGGGKFITTPAVRRMAIEHKVDLNNVIGTGKDGRILKEDILTYLEQQQQQQSAKPAIDVKADNTTTTTTTSQTIKKAESKLSIKKSPTTTTSNIPLNKDRIEPFSSITKGMFKTMTKSLQVPHFGLSEEIDLSLLIKLRPEMKKISNEKNIPISLMPFFIKSTSLALEKYPILNSTIDISGEKIIYHQSHNIGIAMDTKQGLLVPNIKNVNQMTILDIANELNRLQQLGQKGQLGINDLNGGTFTLSNIGSIGGIFGIPVLMPGEVVIGAIGRIRKLPRFIDDDSDQIKRAHIVQVLWSADHRIIDGATMTRFCTLWKEYLENPFRIFF